MPVPVAVGSLAHSEGSRRVRYVGLSELDDILGGYFADSASGLGGIVFKGLYEELERWFGLQYVSIDRNSAGTGKGSCFGYLDDVG